MCKPNSKQPSLSQDRWSLRDFLAACGLFLATAAVVLWQNAHLTILWDGSYTLDTSLRIAQGQMPYRDFPLVHSPFTFLIQAAIMRLTGRVFWRHVLYAAVVGGLGTVLAWRIVLHTLRNQLRFAWSVSLLLAAPLAVLGVYSILPFPSYDCDTAFSILLVMLLLQRLAANSTVAAHANPLRTLLQPFLTGAALPLPLFFKQNIGLPFLAVAGALIILLWMARQLRRREAAIGTPGPAALGAVLAGAIATLVVAVLLLHFTAGVGNYLYWTIHFAAQRRLPGLPLMLGVYAEPSLLWSIPSVAVALVLLRSSFARTLLIRPVNTDIPCPILAPFYWREGGNGPHYLRAGSIGTRLIALGLLAAPFLWTLVSLFLSSDADDRASTLLALWPLLLLLSAALTLWNLCRYPSLRAIFPALLLAAIHGTFLSQQLWGSTYAIWPLLVLLVAEMIVFVASIDPAEAGAKTALRTAFVAPTLAVVIAITLLICGGLYTVSEERLSYARLDEGPMLHATEPALRGMAVSGPYLPSFEELLRFAAREIPFSDGLILLPGEDPFYFATGRVPQFPVLLFDKATDPYSSAQLVAEAQRRKISWLIVKHDMQMKEDPTPQREASLAALQQVFQPYRKLGSYDIYRRP